MTQWFTRWFARLGLVEAPQPEVQRPALDPVLERAVTRIVHRALLALEAGDIPTAQEWVWGLFNTDLPRTGS